MLNLWYDLPSLVQDLLIAVSLTAPTVLFGVLILRGFRTRVLVGALLRHYCWTNLCFVVLIGVSVGLGIAVLAQERALTHGTARAADKFDLVIAAPGFSADCLETREELAIQGREQFEAAGGEQFAALDCLNASDAGIDMLESLVRRELAGWI